MGVETLTEMPSVIEAGNTVRFVEGFSDFPASEWTAQAVLTNGTNVVTADGVAGGDDFEFTFTPALPAGAYVLAIYVAKDGERTRAKSQPVRVRPNLAVSFTSTNTILLGLLITALTNLTVKKFASVDFNGQTYTRQDIGTLYRIKTQLEAAVIKEKRELAEENGAPPMGRIEPQFANAEYCLQ